MRHIINFLIASLCIALIGCYASGHKFYDAYVQSEPTFSCQVIWVHSYDAAKYRLDHLPPVEFIGKSSFTTAHTYNEDAAESDCKKAGGDYIIVISEGVTDRTKSSYTIQSNQTYRANSTTTYSDMYGYYGRSNTSTTYTVPTYQTYDITITRYGYSYFVYRSLEE